MIFSEVAVLLESPEAARPKRCDLQFFQSHESLEHLLAGGELL